MRSASENAGVRFREVQRFTFTWVFPVTLIAAVAAWVPLGMALLGDGSDSVWPLVLVAVLIGIGLPVLIGVARLTVEVFDDRMEVHYRPFLRRTIRFADVADVEAVTYRPLRDYGGWGIKGWSRRKIAYNVRGNRGARLTLADGRTVLIGSQRADELAHAIRQGLRSPR